MIENIYRNIFGWARVRAASPAPQSGLRPARSLIKFVNFISGALSKIWRYASF